MRIAPPAGATVLNRRTSNAPPLTDLALNRATLARQGLLERQPVAVEPMLRHLIALQGQVHNSPYMALWARLETFAPADLEALLKARRAVRATLLRVTLHVALADDYLAIRPLIDSTALRGFRTNHLKPLKGADLDAIRLASRALLADQPLTPQELGRRLQAQWPDIGAIELSMAARFLEPVVHPPPAGLWGATGPPALLLAASWLDDAGMAMPMTPEALALRYLAALGPASGNDFNAWSGFSRGMAILDSLRPQLISFTGEDGRELFDLPEAPRPPESVPAPARLLPDYDNMLVGHANRSRIASPAALKGLWRANGLRPAFTLDGFVAGSWRLVIGKTSARIELTPFAPLRLKDEAALIREAEAMLEALSPAHTAEVQFLTAA